MAGIGTLTYYDPATGQYGALGHDITDVDTAQLMPLASGSIMETTVKAVKKGRKGDPGELKEMPDNDRLIALIRRRLETLLAG